MIEITEAQPVLQTGIGSAADSGTASGMAVAGSNASPEPYVHKTPNFLANPPEKKPPHLNQPPVSFSIKDAMNALGAKLVIAGIPKLSNKDDPNLDQPDKPKSKLKL